MWPHLHRKQPRAADSRSKNFQMTALSQCHSFFLFLQIWGLPSRFQYWQTSYSHWTPQGTQNATQLIRIFWGQLIFRTEQDKLHSQMWLMLMSWTVRGCTALLATAFCSNTYEMFEYLKSNHHFNIFMHLRKQ